MGKIQKQYTSEFYCTCCGKKGLPIMRRAGQDREAGHLKNLYCIYCKTDTNHAEIRPFGSYRKEDFEKEFKLGRFVNGKKEKISDLKKCFNTDCECCVDGKCWNSNKKNQCLEELKNE